MGALLISFGLCAILVLIVFRHHWEAMSAQRWLIHLQRRGEWITGIDPRQLDDELILLIAQTLNNQMMHGEPLDATAVITAHATTRHLRASR